MLLMHLNRPPVFLKLAACLFPGSGVFCPIGALRAFPASGRRPRFRLHAWDGDNGTDSAGRTDVGGLDAGGHQKRGIIYVEYAYSGITLRLQRFPPEHRERGRLQQMGVVDGFKGLQMGNTPCFPGLWIRKRRL